MLVGEPSHYQIKGRWERRGAFCAHQSASWHSVLFVAFSPQCPQWPCDAIAEWCCSVNQFGEDRKVKGRGVSEVSGINRKSETH
jgi:hypothetical protein